MKIFLIILLLFLCGCEKKEIEIAETETEVIIKEEEKFYSEKEVDELSKKVNNWGMRRNAPDRPEFTSEQIQLMDKYGCIYIGTNEEKYLYLTFDEGYENGQTGKILDVLKEKDVPAAFFITGDFFKAETHG